MVIGYGSILVLIVVICIAIFIGNIQAAQEEKRRKKLRDERDRREGIK